MDSADLVGWIVGERDDGAYLYACDQHTPDDRREPHRQVLRDEAVADAAVCVECGVELGEEGAVDG